MTVYRYGAILLSLILLLLQGCASIGVPSALPDAGMEPDFTLGTAPTPEPSPTPDPLPTPTPIPPPDGPAGYVTCKEGPRGTLDHLIVSTYTSDEPVECFKVDPDTKRVYAFTGDGYAEVETVRIDGAVRHDHDRTSDYNPQHPVINGLFAVVDGQLHMVEDYRDEDARRDDKSASPVCVYQGDWIWVSVGIRQWYGTMVLYNVKTNETIDLVQRLVIAHREPLRSFQVYLMANGRKLAVADNEYLCVIDVETEEVRHLQTPLITEGEAVGLNADKTDETLLYLWQTVIIPETETQYVMIYTADINTEEINVLFSGISFMVGDSFWGEGTDIGTVAGLGGRFFYYRVNYTYLVDYYGTYRWLENYENQYASRHEARRHFSNATLLCYDGAWTLIDFINETWYTADLPDMEDFMWTTEWREDDRMVLCQAQPDGTYLTTVYDFELL